MVVHGTHDTPYGLLTCLYLCLEAKLLPRESSAFESFNFNDSFRFTYLFWRDNCFSTARFDNIMFSPRFSFCEYPGHCLSAGAQRGSESS